MKKTYVKPELFFEQFILNQHMANECDWNWTGLNDDRMTGCTITGSAKYGMQDVSIFTSPASCYMMEGTPEAYCYYPSTNALGTFGSGGG